MRASFAGRAGLGGLSQRGARGRFSSPEPSAFEAELIIRPIADCRLARLESSAHRFVSTPPTSRKADLGMVELVYVLGGSVSGSQDGRTVSVGAGQVALLHSEAVFAYKTAGRTDIIRISVPRRLLCDSARLLLPGATAKVFGQSAFARAALGFLLKVSQDEHDPSTVEQGAMQGTLLALVHGLVLSENQDVPTLRARNIRETIDAIILANMGNPELNLEFIVKRAGVSRRQLHRIFEAESATPGDYVRSLRLKAIAHELETTPVMLSLSALSKRYGYANADAMRRAFKAQYNETPRAYHFRNRAGHELFEA